MSEAHAVANRWGQGDIYGLVLSALEKAGKPLNSLTVQDLAPVDHFHARGFPATVELGDWLPVKAGDHILDIGCGLGGPARYLAKRFGCRVSGIDITPAFVVAAQKLTALLRIETQVTIEQGDGQQLSFPGGTFNGAYTQHVTMSVPDRARFFGEAYRVLKAGGFFALTEHGLGRAGNPFYPLPWSTDGSGAYLIPPSETRSLLEAAGFEGLRVEDTGQKYLAAYQQAMQLAAQGSLPPFGMHILMGEDAAEKICNAAQNIEENRTHPIAVVCRKPS